VFITYVLLVSPLALNDKIFPKVVTVLDSSITTSSSVFAVHAMSSSSTVFLSGKDIASYLSALETDDVKIQEIDFQSLSSDATGPITATPKTGAAKEKEDAKIEGAVQIAIGVKKEVDFAAWYTNVRLHVTLPCVDLIRS
jgi:prolyl-tRNA synthetase